MKSKFPLPSLPGPAINEASERRALGYPERYVPETREDTRGLFRGLRRLHHSALAVLIEDAGVPLEARSVAGHILAWEGDPRLEALAPAMVYVPAARAVLGLDPGEAEAVAASYADTGILREWIEKETPRYEADIAAFSLARYPVTNGEYKRFLLETEFPELPSSWSFGRYPIERSNHPVYTVSPAAADAYAAWLRARTGRRFRLPSEAEWEYAASGPERREFPWGDVFVSGFCNTVESGFLSTTPVGMFPEGASAFGAMDMAGNVEEFTGDDYKPYPGARPIDDDLRRSRGDYRVARGGSFTRYRDLARCRRRHGWYPRTFYAMGFRLAEDL